MLLPDCPFCDKQVDEAPTINGLHIPCHDQFNAEMDAIYPDEFKPMDPSEIDFALADPPSLEREALLVF